MRLLDHPSGVEMLERGHCLELLATEEVGRVGFITGGGPEILPVNYVLDGEAVVFATANGTKLWGVTRSPVVFEADSIDRAQRCGWSVIVHGLAQEITENDSPQLIQRLRALELRPWAPGPRPHLIRVAPRFITGRRILPHEAAPAPPEGQGSAED